MHASNGYNYGKRNVDIYSEGLVILWSIYLIFHHKRKETFSDFLSKDLVN